MLKTRLFVIALMAGLMSLFSFSAANAAYTEPPFTSDAPTSTAPGAKFSVTFKSGSVECNPWTATFEGQTAAPGSGTSYTVEFTAPDEPGTYTVTATCTWDPEDTNSASAGLAPISSSNTVEPAMATGDTLLAAPQVDTYQVQIVVGDDGDDNGDDNGSSAGGKHTNGVLPNTGGESLRYLAVGAGLLAVGVGVTYAARRRTA